MNVENNKKGTLKELRGAVVVRPAAKQARTQVQHISFWLTIAGAFRGGAAGVLLLTGSHMPSHLAAPDISGYKLNPINILCHPDIELAVLGSS